MAEKLSVVMSRKHMEAADMALIIIDATEGVSGLDATIAGTRTKADVGYHRREQMGFNYQWERKSP